jgi:hypothetical protein
MVIVGDVAIIIQSDPLIELVANLMLHPIVEFELMPPLIQKVHRRAVEMFSTGLIRDELKCPLE